MAFQDESVEYYIASKVPLVPQFVLVLFALVKPAIVNCVLEKMLFWILGTFVIDVLLVYLAFDSRHKTSHALLRGHS